MKLRVRSIESNQTHRIEIPNSSNLHQLKDAINRQLSLSDRDLCLSLNRKHELSGSNESLQTLGLTSGDLLYFSFNPLSFSSQIANLSNAQINPNLAELSGVVSDQSRGFVDSLNPNLAELSSLSSARSNPNDQSRDIVDSPNPNLAELGGVVSDQSRGLVDSPNPNLAELVFLSGARSNPNDQSRGLVDSPNPNLDESGLSNARSNPNVQSRDIVDSPNPSLAESVVVVSDQSRELMGSIKEGCSNLTDPNDHNLNLGKSKKEGHLENVQSVEEGCSNLTNPNDQARNLGRFKKEDDLENKQLVEGTNVGDEMEVDDDDVECLLEASSKFSVPSFLKKVFVKEVGDPANGGDGDGDHKLIVVAVHAVLLESGFVAYDPISGMKVNGFHLHDEWPKSAFGLSLHYTLPEIASSELVETVVLKFQTLGKFLTIYGSVPKKGFGAHRVSLDETRFIPGLSFILKNGDDTDSAGKSYPNKEIFEFWKIVKDGLSYPLLIDFCEKTGLVPPPCFMLLPTELKLNILETLPAVDLARVSCVSSEVHFLASNNDLWRSKYEEEFGDSANPQRECQWKAKFSSAWEIRKKRKRVCMPYPLREPSLFRPLFPGRRDPNFPGTPFIVGGDYDRMPAFGIPQLHGPRIFRWNCNLGGFP